MPENGGIDRTMIQPDLPEEVTVEAIMEYLSEQREANQHAYDTLAQRLNELPEMVVLAFFEDDVAASQTDVAMSDGRSTRGYCVPEDGSVVAVAIRSNAARSAGTLTLDAAINGTVTGLQVALDATNTTFHVTLQDQGLDTFSAGDAITCEITTDASWAPTTADIIVSVAVVLAKGVR